MNLTEETKKGAYMATWGLHGFLVAYFLSQLIFGDFYNPLAYVVGIATFVWIGRRYN